VAHQIAYRHRMEYDTKVAGVILPVVLLANDRVAAVNAAVDTGSTLCVFQHEIAERLGIRIESGIADSVNAMGTIIKVYGHDAFSGRS